MAYTGFMRTPARRKTGGSPGGVISHKGFVAPVRGWVTAENLAAQKAGSARVLDDMFPEQTGVRLRFGSVKHATVGTEPVESMMAYVGGITRKMFAASDGEIFEVTTVADPDVAPTADVSSLTANYWSSVNFATAGGNFLIAVNGADDMLHYDGTNWAAIDGSSTPAVTGVSTSALSHVSVYRNRLFFVEQGTMNVWYLPSGSIGGSASSLSLAGIFQKGGAVLFTGTWSMDSGDGLDDKFVIVSTEGEVAVYQGSNPSDASDWSIVGRYSFSDPMGMDAVMRAGGDLVVATREGLIPISAAVVKDPAALGLSAVSAQIEPDWQRMAVERPTIPWQIVKWPERNMALIATPALAADGDPMCLAVNVRTGAWARFRQWDVRSVVYHDGWVYFGTNTGTVIQAEIGGTDLGEPYYPTVVWNWDHMGSFGGVKTMQQARVTMLTATPVVPQVSFSTDYQINLPSPPASSGSDESPGLWDIGLWDVAEWDVGVTQQTVSTRWLSVSGQGSSFALQVQFTQSGVVPPLAELVEVTVTYESGALVV